MTTKQLFHILEQIDRSAERIATVLEAHFRNEDRDFQERVMLAIKEYKMKKK